MRKPASRTLPVQCVDGVESGTGGGDTTTADQMAAARSAERAVSARVLPVLLLVVMVSFIDRTKWVGAGVLCCGLF
jgi:hypothetical protein